MIYEDMDVGVRIVRDAWERTQGTSEVCQVQFKNDRGWHDYFRIGWVALSVGSLPVAVLGEAGVMDLNRVVRAVAMAAARRERETIAGSLAVIA